MIDEELALLRAAADDPDDDTLRLAYADWLDEQSGDVFSSHAAFVRLQVRRSRLDVFDPDRIKVLDEETELARKHCRRWNGRIHRRLQLQGLPGKVDARRGLIREWSYHRGMIAHVTVSATGLVTHPELIFSLGPVESLKMVGWPTGGWVKETQQAVSRWLPRLKVLALTDRVANVLPDLSRVTSLALVPLLDLRSMQCANRANQLLDLTLASTISPVVLFRRIPTVPRPVSRRSNAGIGRPEVDHIVDPFDQWNRLRCWHGDLTGEVLSPIPYQRTGR